ncbi:MAG: helix-turn-helix transcriptional regulator [Ruminococcaceae bacterium]|nr:helix-turn-helix transcriptional regulator [Oscillospiraceae bacterium]
MIILKIYIQRLIDLRTDADLTQTTVGKVINKSQQGYDHIENGRANISVDDIITLCKFYNVSPLYVLGFTDEIEKLKQ